MSKKDLEKLIEEATVDCYDEYECLAGFEAVLDDNLDFPFEGAVVGEKVEVLSVHADTNYLLAKCRRGTKTYDVDLVSIKYNPKKVKGGKWIEAYKLWLKDAS